MGNSNLPEPLVKPEVNHAVNAIIEGIRKHNGIELVTLGPLTNIACAIRMAPDIVKNIKQCYVMGGAACCVGNVTASAEYSKS